MAQNVALRRETALVRDMARDKAPDIFRTEKLIYQSDTLICKVKREEYRFSRKYDFWDNLYRISFSLVRGKNYPSIRSSCGTIDSAVRETLIDLRKAFKDIKYYNDKPNPHDHQVWLCISSANWGLSIGAFSLENSNPAKVSNLLAQKLYRSLTHNYIPAIINVQKNADAPVKVDDSLQIHFRIIGNVIRM